MTLLENGIPEDGRAYMGMLGFKVVINVHGEVVRLDQPAGDGRRRGWGRQSPPAR